jgi:hypothetical protein
MAGKTFKLEDLAPDRPGIEFEGRRYEAQLPQDFGLVVEAQRLKLTKEYGVIMESFAEDPTSVENAQRIHDILGDLIKVFFPTLPDEVLAKTATPLRVSIVNWWREECYPQALSRMTDPQIQMGPQPAHA